MTYFISSSRVILLIAACIVALGASSGYAQSDREYQIKAAFLYNFTKYVSWPAGKFADEDTPLSLCVIGDDPFGPVLEQTVAGKTFNGRRILINRLQALDDLKYCHLLFVSSSERERVAQITTSASGAGVLSMGDMDNFAELGGVINLTKRRNKIRIEINRTAADRAGLTISSRLLKLATIVEE